MSAQTWNGKYTDPMYGGYFYICTSYVGGVTYGQGVFSELGYMRGTIDSHNNFVGNFWTGGEVKQGTFNLTLNNNGFTGSFVELPTIEIPITSSLLSSKTPTNLECFKADDSMLNPSVDKFDITGNWQTEYFFYQHSDDRVQASYDYFYQNGIVTQGFFDMKAFNNGQFFGGTWSENGGYRGNQVFSVLNSTHIYNTWWFIDRLTDFNYTAMVDDPNLHLTEILHRTESKLDMVTESNINNCNILLTESDEASCWSKCNYDDDFTKSQEIGIGIGIVVVFFVAFACGYFLRIYMSKMSLLNGNKEKSDKDIQL